MGNVCGCSSGGERLLVAVEENEKKEVEDILKAHPPKVARQLARYSSFVNRRTPIHVAAAKGNHEVVDILVRYGADVDMRSYCGQTALMIACRHGHRETVQTLMLHHADVQMMDVSNGRTALHYAACGGKVTCARLLLSDHIASVPVLVGKRPRPDKGVSFQVREDSKWRHSPGRSLGAVVNARADKGVTPLHLAAVNGHSEVVNLLLDVGARVNAMTRSDGDFLDVSVMGMHNSPLHYAASSGNLQCCQILLAYGADRSKENGNGWNACYIAKLWRHRAALEELLDPALPLSPLPHTPPTRYLALPLHSVMNAARELGLNTCLRSDTSVHGGAAGDALNCCATNRVCPVCMDRHCTLAADGCNHELCTSCALNLCAVGANTQNTVMPQLNPTSAIALTSPAPEQGTAQTMEESTSGVPSLSMGGPDPNDMQPTREQESSLHSAPLAETASGTFTMSSPNAISGMCPTTPPADSTSITADGTPSAASVAASAAATAAAATAAAAAADSAAAARAAAAMIGSLPCPLCRHPIFCFFQIPKESSNHIYLQTTTSEAKSPLPAADSSVQAHPNVQPLEDEICSTTTCQASKAS